MLDLTPQCFLIWKPFIMILIMKNKSYLIQKINNINDFVYQN